MILKRLSFVLNNNDSITNNCYFNIDWACGGQWNRMLQFLAVLIQAMEMSGLEIAVFFNGCFEPLRRADWVQHQLQVRAKVNNVSLLYSYISDQLKNKSKF